MWDYLPLLFLLACPLMMLFMMGGMRGGHGSTGHDADVSVDRPTDLADQGRIADLEQQVRSLRDQLAEQADAPQAGRSPDRA